MGLDRFWGNQTLEDIHEIISNVLLALVCVHLSGVFLDSFTSKRKTWMVMITGKKE
jgi:cytochrome b